MSLPKMEGCSKMQNLTDFYTPLCMQSSHEKTKPAKRENEKRAFMPVKGKSLQRDKLRQAKRNNWM